jgi:heme/copper-type cytochrome/quinol oxidase subunit 4
MIPTIGVMIGAYIFTRMFEIFVDENQNLGTKIFAIVTLAIAVIGSIMLILNGATGAASQTLR